MVDDLLVAAPIEVFLDQLPARAELIVELDEEEVFLGRPGSLGANSRVNLVLPSLSALVWAAALKVNGYLLPGPTPLVGLVLNDKLFKPLVFLWSPLLTLRGYWFFWCEL